MTKLFTILLSFLLFFPSFSFAQPIHLSPLQWTVTNTAAANGTPSATKAAAAGTRHVATSITACVSVSTTVATTLRVDLKDDTTVVWTGFVNVPTTTSANQCILLSGLNIVGTTNKDMVLAFAAVLGTTNTGTVTLTGYSL